MTETFEDRLMRQSAHVRVTRDRIERLRLSADTASRGVVVMMSVPYRFDDEERRIMVDALRIHADQVEAELEDWLENPT